MRGVRGGGCEESVWKSVEGKMKVGAVWKEVSSMLYWSMLAACTVSHWLCYN